MATTSNGSLHEQHNLVLALRRQVSKLRLHSVDEHRPVAERLIEVGLLMLNMHGPDLDDIEILPDRTYNNLQQKTARLLDVLDTHANNDFNPEQKHNAAHHSQVAGSSRDSRNRGEPTPYRRLRTLLKSAVASDGPFDISSGEPCSLFYFGSAQDLEETESALSGYNSACSGIKSRAPVSVVTSDGNDDLDTGDLAKANSQLAQLDRLFLLPLTRMLAEIHRQFLECGDDPPKPPHQIFLQLDIDELNSVSVEERKVELCLACPLAPAVLHSTCQYTSVSMVPSASTRSLCQQLKSCCSHLKSLDLSFNAESCTIYPAHSRQASRRDGRALHKISLGDLINTHGAFNPPLRSRADQYVFTHTQKRKLAATLAFSFLILFTTQHKPRLWTNEIIQFFESTTRLCATSKPYIHCDSGKEQVSEHVLFPDDGEPVPCFIFLAKLLLELEYGRIPEVSSTIDSETQEDHSFLHVKDFYDAKRDYSDDSRRSYLDAVEACLDFRHAYDLERAQASATSETPSNTCKRLILSNIVEKVLQRVDVSRKRPREPQDHIPHEGVAQATCSDSECENGKRCRNRNHKTGAMTGCRRKIQRHTYQHEVVLGTTMPTDPGPTREMEKLPSTPLGSSAATSFTTNGHLSRQSVYTVGWLCALTIELTAALRMMDGARVIDTIYRHGNEYHLGHVAGHGVVMTCLPLSSIGNTEAAKAATQMVLTFPTIRHFVLVGIGGGVPTDQDQIRLGDVVIGLPKGEYSGVVQYDLGKLETAGTFSMTGSLPPPSRALLNAVRSLQMDEILDKPSPAQYLSAFDDFQNFRFPGRSSDPRHIVAPTSCDTCNCGVTRSNSRQSDDPKVFFGTIASGNKVIKNAVARDEISRDLGGVLCFEMEAAGVLSSCQCVVVRGICDYADERKDKTWQPYAASTAAVYAKALIYAIHDAET